MGLSDLFKSKSQKQKEHKEALIAEYRKLADKYQKTQRFFPIECDINLQKNEECYFKCDDASWGEERKVRQSKRVGGSVRITKGFWLHQGASESRSHSEMRVIDTGRVYVTSKRIVFIGHLQTRVIHLNKILEKGQFIDALAISHGSSKRSFIFTPNPYILHFYVQMVPIYSRTLGELRKEGKTETEIDEFFKLASGVSNE